MLKSILSKIRSSRILRIITIVTLVFSTIAVYNFTSNESVKAASAPVSINLIYYGTNSRTTNQSIIDANPEYLVNNSPAGPWRGNADISQFTSAGIKYFEYIDGGYEGNASQAIPNDLESNLNYIDAIAKAGAYGVFVDEVSSFPSAAALEYLKQLADRAHSLGLQVVFNAGVNTWSDSLMDYCDFINSSEVWNNAPLTSSQIKWASRTWFLTQGVNDAATAADLTNAAWNKGVKAAYACNSYMALPAWLANYITLIEPDMATTPIPEPETVAIPITAPAVAINPVTPPAPIVTPIAEPATVIIPIAAPAVVVTPIATPTVVVTPIAAPASVVTPATVETPIAAPSTIVILIAEPAVVVTPIAQPADVLTPPEVSGNTAGTFFSGLWESLDGVWNHLLDWLGI